MQEITISAMPGWVDATEEQPARARARFLLRLAACLATPDGSMRSLSDKLGYHRNTLGAMLASGSLDNGLPVPMIKSIEQLIGIGVIPRQLMNPEVYDQH